MIKRSDGIVLIDPVKAQGQKQLVKSCPYGAIWWNEEEKLAQKCTLCAHLLDDGWQAPRCVQACPTGALSFATLEDDQFGRMVNSQGLEPLGGPDNPTRPNVVYKNLHRFKKCFISGSVATGQQVRAECVKGAVIKLIQDETVIGQVETDFFGDFKFDRLAERSGIYHIEIFHQDALKKKMEITLGKSISVGTLWI